MPATTPARRLWFGVLAGPLAWIIDELAAVALAYDHCAAGLRVPLWLGAMTLIGLAAAAVTAVALWSSWQLTSAAPLDSGLGDVTEDRMRFMARFGMTASVLSLFAIVLRTATVLFLGANPC